MSERVIPPVPPMDMVVSIPCRPDAKEVDLFGTYPLDVLRAILDNNDHRTCANCKWWECKPGQNRGTCIAVNWPPKGREGLAFIHKGTGPLETHEAFSCNQWEPK